MPGSESNTLRVIDANINRANEAFRVIEDSLRFVIEDEHLTRVCKNLRHEFAVWHQQFEIADRVSMRDASGDVGRRIDVETEYQRSGIDAILRANLSRATQSLRTLEEFSKTIDSQVAREVERIRYRVYDLEKAILTLRHSSERMSNATLYVLTDGCGELSRFEAKINSLVSAGVDMIQLRDKSLDDRQLLRYGTTLVECTRPHGVISIINDRADIALAVAADGIHLGQEDMPSKQARQITGPAMLLGVSTHNIEQARQAVLDGANYIGVGPTFPSTTKSFAEFTGIELLRRVNSETALPSFAVGGINPTNLMHVLESGFMRIAISGAVPADPREIAPVVRQFRSQLDSEAFADQAAGLIRARQKRIIAATEKSP